VRQHKHHIVDLPPQMKGKIGSSFISAISDMQKLDENFRADDPRAYPGNCLIDMFEDRISFLKIPDDTTCEEKYHIIADKWSDSKRDDLTVFGSTDASVQSKGLRLAALAAILWHGPNKIGRFKGYPGIVTAPDAELFAVLIALKEAVKVPDINKIIIFMDSLAAAKKSIDPGIHSDQKWSLKVCSILQPWLSVSDDRRVEFQHCPSGYGWEPLQTAHEWAKSDLRTQAYEGKTSLGSVCKMLTESIKSDWIHLFGLSKY
jgi:ribonuclease HI